MQVVRHAERFRKALLSDVGIAAVPGCAGGFQRDHQFVGQELLGRVEDLPGGGCRRGDVPRLQPRGDQRKQGDPAVAATGDERAEVELSIRPASRITSSGCPSCQASQA